MIAGLALLDDPGVVGGGFFGAASALGASPSSARTRVTVPNRCRLRAWWKRKRSAPGL
jgi:hypothetical protein